MGRVEIPTKYIFPRGLARGWVVDYGVLAGGKKQKQQKTENGRPVSVYQHIYGRSPTRPPSSARVVVDVDVLIFSI